MSRIAPMRSKNLVLNLLQASLEQSISVQNLLTAGRILSMSESAIRVTLTRLVKRGVVESDERGQYRLAAQADPVSQHVHEWHLGERRLRRWDGGWLACFIPRRAPDAPKTRKRTLWALHLFGFREGRPGIWVRPDNLVRDVRDVEDRLRALGLEAAGPRSMGRRLSPPRTRRRTARRLRPPLRRSRFRRDRCRGRPWTASHRRWDWRSHR